MKPNERKRLAALLASMTPNERNRIYKRAAKLRKQERKRTKPSRRRQDWLREDGETRHGPRRIPATSLRDLVLTLLSQEETAGAHCPPDPESRTARGALVVGVGPGTCEVMLANERVTCALDGELRRRAQSDLAVGDRVLLEERAGRHRVAGVLPRRSTLSRRDPHNPRRERVLVANVDTVVIVAALKQPPLRTGMIERFLIAIERGGAQPLLVANKADLCDETELQAELGKLEPYRRRGIRLVVCSAADARGIDELRCLLEGRLCAFVGKSGVGKTSLLNTLAPELVLATAEVRARDGKGRHTTTRSTLHELAGGARVIDTPGIRALGLERLDAGELGRYFPEFEIFAGGCRFRDCSHSHEPDCEVQLAVQEGHIGHARWLAYLRLLGVE